MVFTPYNVIKKQYELAKIDWQEAYRSKQKFLDIYSKEGLYGFYAAYKLFQEAIKLPENKDIAPINLWNKIISNQIYLCCKNRMFKAIAIKVLGFSLEQGNKNIQVIDYDQYFFKRD